MAEQRSQNTTVSNPQQSGSERDGNVKQCNTKSQGKNQVKGKRHDQKGIMYLM